MAARDALLGEQREWQDGRDPGRKESITERQAPQLVENSFSVPLDSKRQNIEPYLLLVPEKSHPHRHLGSQIVCSLRPTLRHIEVNEVAKTHKQRPEIYDWPRQD